MSNEITTRKRIPAQSTTGHVRTQREAGPDVAGRNCAASCCTLAVGHTMLLPDRLNDKAGLEAYAAAALSNGWSRADLRQAIEISR